MRQIQITILLILLVYISVCTETTKICNKNDFRRESENSDQHQHPIDANISQTNEEKILMDFTNDYCETSDSWDTDIDYFSTDNCSDQFSEDELDEIHSSEFIPTFSEKLQDCFINMNVKQCQGTAILKLLRAHKCFLNLSADHRTLVGTPRKPIKII